jgi:hypothetical protein
VSKNGLFEPFIYKNLSFYQDRLVTNIHRKTQKKDRFSSGRRQRSIGCWSISHPVGSHAMLPTRSDPMQLWSMRRRCWVLTKFNAMVFSPLVFSVSSSSMKIDDLPRQAQDSRKREESSITTKWAFFCTYHRRKPRKGPLLCAGPDDAPGPHR